MVKGNNTSTNRLQLTTTAGVETIASVSEQSIMYHRPTSGENVLSASFHKDLGSSLLLKFCQALAHTVRLEMCYACLVIESSYCREKYGYVQLCFIVKRY